MAITTGFVQRLMWFGGSNVCAWIGPEPDSVEALFVAMRGTNGEAALHFKGSIIGLLVEAQLAGREVAVTHADDSGEIAGVGTVAADLRQMPLQLDAIEVTQAVQDLSHSIPLLAGKGTVVRAYLSNYADASVTVLGEIAIRRSPSEAPLTVTSVNTVVLNRTDAGNLAAKRNDATLSLNFLLPAEYTTAGPLNIRISSITDTVTGVVLPVGSSRSPSVWFHESVPLRVRILGMSYAQGTPPVVHQPTNLDFELLLSWLTRAYPIGRVIGTTATVTTAATAPFTSGDINAELAAIRALDVSAGVDARTHYYGLVSDGGFFMRGSAAGIPGTPDPATVASGPTGAGTWGWDNDGSYGDWYGGHELGHTLGRLHPGFCGETQDDLANYPFASGQLASSDASFVGFDVGDTGHGIPMAALPGTRWHDVMTYCNFQWTSAYTYLGMRRRLHAEDQLAAGPGAGPPAPGSSGGRPDERFPHARPRAMTERSKELARGEALVSVVAKVNLTAREGEIKFVNPVERAVAPARAQEARAVRKDDAVILRVRTPEEVLHEYPVDVRLDSELRPEEDRVGLVTAVIPIHASARSIELVIGEAVVDVFPVGGGPPSPEEPARKLRDAVAPRGHTYAVQVSTDQGRTWLTVAVGLKEPSFKLDERQFRDGQEVQIRVMSTDGLETRVVASESVRIRKP